MLGRWKIISLEKRSRWCIGWRQITGWIALWPRANALNYNNYDIGRWLSAQCEVSFEKIHERWNNSRFCVSIRLLTLENLPPSYPSLPPARPLHPFPSLSPPSYPSLSLPLPSSYPSTLSLGIFNVIWSYTLSNSIQQFKSISAVFQNFMLAIWELSPHLVILSVISLVGLKYCNHGNYDDGLFIAFITSCLAMLSNLSC